MPDKIKPEKLDINRLHHPIILATKYVEREPGTEEDRQTLTKFYKLGSNATWGQVWDAVYETDRKFYARKYGLPENATWEELKPHIVNQHIQSGALDKILDIPSGATTQERKEIAKDFQKRLHE